MPYKKYNLTFVLLSLVSLLVLSCNNDKRNEEPIVQVGSKSLYLSDISDIFLQGISKEDSINLLTDYANRWARKQLILKKAESNLSNKEKDVSAELDDYRASLLIFRYEQAYIAQRMDTVVRQSELESFYNDNSANFQLLSPLIKGIFIKIPSDAPTLKNIRELYKSKKESDIEELENLSFQGAVRYDYFNGDWVELSPVLKELPINARDYENELINKRYLDLEDGQYTYLISVRDIKLKGTIAPFEHVRENIRTIILNKRKQDMVKKLENDIYKEALNRDELKINI